MKQEIISIIPGQYKTVTEAIQASVKLNFAPDMDKVQARYEEVYERTQGLLQRSIQRMMNEAVEEYSISREAELIAEAEQRGMEDAIAQVMADHSHLGLTEEMLKDLLGVADAEEEAAQAKAAAEAEAIAEEKRQARIQRELQADLKAALKEAKAVLLTLEEIGDAFSNILGGVIAKAEAKAEAGNLSPANVKEVTSQTKAGNNKVLAIQAEARRAELEAKEQEFQAGAVAWLNSEHCTLSEEEVQAFNSKFSNSLRKPYAAYLKALSKV
jgi:hypothetical protein